MSVLTSDLQNKYNELSNDYSAAKAIIKIYKKENKELKKEIERLTIILNKRGV